MALELILDKLEGVDDSIKPLYKEQNGKFILDVVGAAPKAKLDEFRANNIKLQKELDDAKALMGQVDVEEYKKLKEEQQKIADKKMIDAGKIDELVEQKTERMKKDFASQVEALQNSLKGKDDKLTITEQRLSSVLIDNELQKAVTSVGVPRQGAIQDILNRGRSVWKLVDGEPVPMIGDKLLYGKEGKVLTFTEWAQELVKEASYLFEPSKGANSGGGSIHGMTSLGGIDLSKVDAATKMRLARESGKVGK
jgi:hypothetical protein